MPAPTITPLPAYPVRGEDQTTFATKANATVAAMPTMVTETNAVAEYVETTAAEVEANATEVDTNTTAVLAIAGAYTTRHQGAHATAPTLRNDGSALQPGDLYYDTVSGKTKLWEP